LQRQQEQPEEREEQEEQEQRQEQEEQRQEEERRRRTKTITTTTTSTTSISRTLQVGRREGHARPLLLLLPLLAVLTLAGLEPAIFGSEDQRLIH
jgi:hypothetical protein